MFHSDVDSGSQETLLTGAFELATVSKDPM